MAQLKQREETTTSPNGALFSLRPKGLTHCQRQQTKFKYKSEKSMGGRESANSGCQKRGRKILFVKLVRPLLPDPTVSTNGISRFKSIPSLLS